MPSRLPSSYSMTVTLGSVTDDAAGDLLVGAVCWHVGDGNSDPRAPRHL
jgi:hypothetical protein